MCANKRNSNACILHIYTDNSKQLLTTDFSDLLKLKADIYQRKTKRNSVTNSLTNTNKAWARILFPRLYYISEVLLAPYINQPEQLNVPRL